MEMKLFGFQILYLCVQLRTLFKKAYKRKECFASCQNDRIGHIQVPPAQFYSAGAWISVADHLDFQTGFYQLLTGSTLIAFKM